jgi:hypothetical protein
MDEGKHLPEFTSYEEIADFWDTHSLADYWEQTEPAEFEVSEQARRRYVVHIDRDLLSRVQRVAQKRGVSTESLVNLLLEQRLREIEVPTAS